MHLLNYRPILAILAFSLVLAGCATTQVTEIRKAGQAPEQAAVPSVETFTLKKTIFQQNIKIPGELTPYETVDIHPKIEGFIQSINVDRGSTVHRGQLLASLVAPELESQLVEAQSKVKAAKAADAEANAKYFSDKGYYDRLHEASQVPGVISDNELATAKMTAQAAKAHVSALQSVRMASFANVSSLARVRNYLQIRSPINGVVTERNLHPGALVGPAGAGAAEPILKIEDLSRLRLLVSIPERYYSSVHVGASIPFTVSAYPGKIFTGIVSRPAYSLDEKNRTEAVELDVPNVGKALSPGMYADVKWTIARPGLTFMVPASAVVSTTERTFVERLRDGKIQWVDVQKGFSDANQIEIFGNIQPQDILVRKASDELRDGMPVRSWGTIARRFQKSGATSQN